jgi:hypothetical protein
MGAQEHAGHGAEELVAEEPGDDGKPGGQRVGQAGGDIVAIDVEATACGAALGIGQPGGRRRLGSRSAAPKLDWQVIASHASTGWSTAAARSASALSVGQSGTSVSHSISVGRGPERAMVWA